MKQAQPQCPVSTPEAPQPAGHYSQGVVAGNMVFVSGQLPIDPATGEPLLGSMGEQTRQTLENVAAVVRAAGGAREHIVKLTIYIPDGSKWGEVNAAFAEFFGDHRPARAVIPCRELALGVGIEAEAIAVLPDPS